MRRPASFAALALALAMAAAGCTGDKSATAPAGPGEPAPNPNTPANVVRLLEWCWNHRDTQKYGELFTEDYRFVFAMPDSAGNAYRDVPFGRLDELAAASALFDGSDAHLAAIEIVLDFDQTLVALPDDRPGRNPTWHRTVRTRVDLKATIDRGGGPEVWEVHGYAKFYTVRGDSAQIPPDLAARGFGPDSTRWWIDRWEDETLPEGALRANPTQSRSWGGLKAMFR
jgi:hypothetical protein